MKKELAVVILAAGKGTRMKNPDRAKVMFEVDGKPMVEHVVRLAESIHSKRIIVVAGFQRETVIDYLHHAAPAVEFAVQDPQLGTGHAVMQAESLLADFTGDILVLSGDVPLLTEATIVSLMDQHSSANAVATILTAIPDDPAGYGRVLRDGNGDVVRIVEHKDATEEERLIREINSGIYIFRTKELLEALHSITPDNAQNEYYLPDVFSCFKKNNVKISAQVSKSFDEIRGVNTVDQLREVELILQARTMQM